MNSDASKRRVGILVVKITIIDFPAPNACQKMSYALLHFGDVELDMRLELHVLIVGTVHLMLDVLFQVGHLSQSVNVNNVSATYHNSTNLLFCLLNPHPSSFHLSILLGPFFSQLLLNTLQLLHSCFCF